MSALSETKSRWHDGICSRFMPAEPIEAGSQEWLGPDVVLTSLTGLVRPDEPSAVAAAVQTQVA
jgi:hypothetical protein